MNILKFLRFLIGRAYQSYVRCNSESFIIYLRKKGVRIGENVRFYEPWSNTIDLTRPYMISIGDKVKITKGVVILTHGFDWSVLRELYKRPFGSAGRVDIGNNVFIGINSIILKNVSVGNNVVIAAGSVVTKNIPDNSVVAGNPATVVMNIEDLYRKYLKREKIEAANEAVSIKSQLLRDPQYDDFKEFFYLYLRRDHAEFEDLPVSLQVGDYMDEFMKSVPVFEDFSEFIAFSKVNNTLDADRALGQHVSEGGK